MRSVHALALPVALLLALGLSVCGSGGQIPISEPTKSAGEIYLTHYLEKFYYYIINRF